MLEPRRDMIKRLARILELHMRELKTNPKYADHEFVKFFSTDERKKCKKLTEEERHELKMLIGDGS